MRRGCRAVVAATAVALLAPAAAEAQGERPSKRCDFTDPAVCLYPWPNDHYTKRDPSTPTGRRLALSRRSMPANKDGVHIDPLDMNRADGFSPGSMLLTKVPGLETVEAARASRLPPIGDVSRSLARRSPVVVINARTGRRHPVWAEIDSNPDTPADRVLIVRPARQLRRGRALHRRPPEPQAGRRQSIGAGRAFRLYRDRARTRRPAIERRRSHYERLFRKLRRAEVRRGNLVPGLGLHGGQPAQPQRPGAPPPRPGLRRAGGQEPARPEGEGALAAIHGQIHRLRPARRGRPDRPPD